MKNFLFALGFVASNAFGSCPDFSGVFQAKFVPQDYRETSTMSIVQSGCEKIDLNEKITFRKGWTPAVSSTTWEVSQVAVDNGWYWDGPQLIFLQKNANTEHCDIRDTYRLDGANLVYRWRFECPNKPVSPWYIDNTVGGVYYRQ